MPIVVMSRYNYRHLHENISPDIHFISSAIIYLHVVKNILPITMYTTKKRVTVTAPLF